jgi:hypothetical protein
MEISQLSLFSLLLHSAVGGAFLGALREMTKAVCLFFGMLASPRSGRELSGRLEKRIGERTLAARPERPNRLLRITRNLAIAAIDAAFMTAAAVVLIIIAYACNSGRMRWMIIVGFVLGFFVLRITVGRLIRKILRMLAVIAAVLVIKAVGVICTPFRMIKNVFSLKIKRKTKGGPRCEK